MQKETFDKIWEKGILYKGRQIVDSNVGKVVFDEKAKDRILNEYNKLRDYSKVSYMRNPDGLLDRHKVCACLIIAISKTAPLIDSSSQGVSDLKNIYNENLAISVGLSLLRQYIITANKGKKEYIKIFEKGFIFPETERDTRYQELLCLMLSYDIENGHYSILALANILFMIEEYTKVTYKPEMNS